MAVVPVGGSLDALSGLKLTAPQVAPVESSNAASPYDWVSFFEDGDVVL